MANILEKRFALHKRLANQERLNKQLQSEIGQIRPLADIGLVSAMIAHEMNNILTPLGSYAQLAMDNPDDEALTRKTIKKTAANSARATKILKSMLAMANGRKPEKKNRKLNAMLDEIFGCIARDFAKDRIHLIREISEDLTICSDSVAVEQVLMNLILNAREAMLGRGGTLTISAEQLPDAVRVKVTDTGCGITAEKMQEIFEPFYTTKKCESESQRAGAGLGLAFCKRVIDAHNGSISVESRPMEKTTFSVTLPKQ